MAFDSNLQKVLLELANLGLYKKKVDGLYGSGTANALKMYLTHSNVIKRNATIDNYLNKTKTKRLQNITLTYGYTLALQTAHKARSKGIPYKSTYNVKSEINKMVASAPKEKVKAKWRTGNETPVKDTTHSINTEGYYTGWDKLKSGNILGGLSDIGTSLFFDTHPFIRVGTDYLATRLQDNMYPYSYGDMITTADGKSTYYNGKDIPEGATLRLTTANDSKVDLRLGIVSKIWNGLWYKDPRRIAMDEIADLDLNTPEGMTRYKELIKTPGLTYAGIAAANPKDYQFNIRARLDNMSYYANRPMKYGTYTINTDYNSPTALSRGATTYRIADENMRKRYNLDKANAFMKYASYGHATSDGRWVTPVMTELGNASVVGNKNGTNLTYGDWWDYIINSPSGRRLYTADRLPNAKGKNTGINHRAMTESSDDLFSGDWKETFNTVKDLWLNNNNS